ncbi:2-amino-4-hydroxy-6-hydroxymethyldihydropteridine diphosphokinase [Parvularcula oceani]|uniref:2-amino-4-hydroxy-6- hydroxymethyldihydropteridine diphosphokinase n=1 Tax=Parvularcula oceani TaxID=1247963 RepID=UPI0004E1A555|nr:2-amino-4-hydroxy-6-hydroxymethyldihydropteridine diphosphokinase [Parvularcula oceani]
MTQTALVALGSNRSFGGLPPRAIVERAAAALSSLGEARLSPLYSSLAWPDPSAPPYVNAVAMVRTTLAPEAMLAGLLAIEAGFARRRDPAERYGARTLDLDLLAQDGEVRDTAELTLPHPRLAERDFVLRPLADLAPAWFHPVTKTPVEAMIAALPEGSARPL